MTARSQNQWENNNPAHIQEMVDALSTADVAVETLKRQLAIAQTARDTIYRELARYMALTAPINQIPPEVLSLIFEHSDTEQARRNATLSLVCKSWWTVVNETPTLWAHIVIRCGWDVKELRPLWLYVNKCISRSKGASLDIVLDMQEVLEYSSYLAKVLQDPFSWMERDPIDESLSLHLASRSTQHQDLEDSIHRQYERLTASTINKLSGAVGEHVHRWRSFKLLTPLSLSQRGLISIWRALAEGHHDELLNFEFWTGLTSFERLPESHASFPFLAAVKRFATDQNISINQLALNPRVLEGINLRNDVTAGDFLLLASITVFSSLLALDLSIWQDTFLPPFANDSIYLPQLASLKLRGSTSQKMAQLFKAPALKALYFESYRGDIDITNGFILATLETLNIHALTFRRRLTMSPVDVEGLKRMLTQCPSLIHLLVSNRVFGGVNDLRSAISQLRQGGVPLAQMKEITMIHGTDPFTSKPALLEVIDVSDG